MTKFQKLICNKDTNSDIEKTHTNIKLSMAYKVIKYLKYALRYQKSFFNTQTTFNGS